MTSYRAAQQQVNNPFFFTTMRFMFDHTSFMTEWPKPFQPTAEDNFFFVPAEVNKYFAHHLKVDETEFTESIIDFGVVYWFAPVLLLTFF